MLIVLLLGFFLIKTLILLPFYFKQFKPMLLVVIGTSLAIAPLITILYHETSLDFWFVYAAMVLGDIFVFYYLVQRNGWKALPASFLVNTILIVFFFLING